MSTIVLNPIVEEEEDEEDVIFNFTPQKVHTRSYTRARNSVLNAPRKKNAALYNEEEMLSMRYEATCSSDNEFEEEREVWARKRYFATKIDVAAALKLSIDGLWDMQEMRTDPKFVQYIDEAKMRRIQRMLQFKLRNGFADEDDFHYICSTVRFFILASYDMELHLKQSDLLLDAYENAEHNK